MNNREIAEIFHSIADILEIKNENPFRIRAYRKAAQVIEELSQPIKDIYINGKLAKRRQNSEPAGRKRRCS